MNKASWFSADIESGDVVAKTDIKDDGTVRRYEYTEPGNIRAGHGDKSYKSYEDFLDDHPDYIRDKDDPESINRRWFGNGYDLGINDLLELTSDELRNIMQSSINNYVHSTVDLMIEEIELEKKTAKQLILKK